MSLLSAIGAVVNEVELRTRLTPALRVRPGEAAEGGKPSTLLRWLRPTLTVRTTTEEYTVAPYGQAPAGNAGAVALASGTLLLLGAVFGAGYLLGKAQE